MEHPFVVFRSLRDLTQDNLAEKLGVTRHYYLRLEQGLYHEIPERILTQLSDEFGTSKAELSAAYREFQKEQRYSFKAANESFKSVLKNYSGLAHPLVYYRSEMLLTRMGLCKGLCLHYDGVTQYEANKQRGVPLDLKLACSDIYWDYTYLETAVAEWRQSGRADRSTKKTA